MDSVRKQIKKKKLSKNKQLFVDKIYGQKQIVYNAFKVLEKAFIAWNEAMGKRVVAVEENKSNWECGNPHQREINNLADAAEKFALQMGVPSYYYVTEKITNLRNKILDKVEDDSIL